MENAGRSSDSSAALCPSSSHANFLIPDQENDNWRVDRRLNWYFRNDDPRTRSRYILALFRRYTQGDERKDRINYEGYRIHWANGEPASLGLDRFCQLGCRLLGLGRKMRNQNEQLVEIGVHPLDGLDAPLTQLGQGIRCRRFYFMREGQRARLYFFNGTETEVTFDLEKDEPRVLDWLGVADMEEGEQFWLDLSAQTV